MYKKIVLIIVFLCLFLFPARPAFAVVGNGSLGDWDINRTDPLHPVVSFTNLDFFTANCTGILIMCGTADHIYTACRSYPTCSGVFPASWNTFDSTQLQYGQTVAVGVYIGNGGEQVYTGSTDWAMGADPIKYKMNTGIQSSASGLLGSMTAQLFRVIIIGVGIVGGVIVTLFGLRWMIRFVRRNIHG